MRKLVCFALLCVGISASAQLSNVTGTVTDTDNQKWNNGAYQITFVPPTGYTGSVYTFNGSSWTPTVHNGVMSGSGVLTYSSLERNDYILPANSHWKFTVCPNASFPCTSRTVTINQASQDISSQFNAVQAPRFAASNAQTGSFGYLDVEISPATPPVGSSYFNVTVNQPKVWNGTTWQTSGGGSATPGGTSTNVQFNDSGVLGGNGNFTFDKNTGIVNIDGALGSTAVTIGPHAPPASSWTLDTYSPNTAFGSIVPGATLTGTGSSQVAQFPGIVTGAQIKSSASGCNSSNPFMKYDGSCSSVATYPGVTTDNANGLNVVGQVTAPVVSSVQYLSPSGDTTCATDTAALTAAIATGGRIVFKAGDFYVTGPFNVNKPMIIEGASAATTLWNCSATANVFNVNYEAGVPIVSAQGHGAILRSFDIAQKAGVTPTGGCGLNVASASGANFYVTGFTADNIHYYRLWRGICLGTGQISNWFKNQYVYNSIAGQTGCVEYNTPIPGGDDTIEVQCSGSGSGINIDQSDVNTFVNLKTNGIGVKFTGAGATNYVRFVNFSIESGGGNNGQCGFDFGSGSNSPTAIQLIGGSIDLIQTALCNTAHATTLWYAFEEHTTAAQYASVWQTNINGTTAGTYVTAPTGPNDAGAAGQWGVDGTYYYAYDPFNVRWQRIAWDSSWSSTSANSPVFSPSTGVYGGTKSVTISSGTSGATLCYTTNGTTPAATTPGTCSTGSTYSTPVSVASSLTVKALASKSGFINSSVTQAGYTVYQVYDTFAGTNGATLNSHTTNDAGYSWVQYNLDGTSLLLLNGSNAVKGVSGSGTSYVNMTPTSADYSVSGLCTVTTGGICKMEGRVSTGVATFYEAVFLNGTGVQLYKLVSGAVTQLGSTYSGVTTGAHTIGLSMIGTSISASVDGVPVITATDSTITAAGVPALSVTSTGATVSGFTVQ
jgi:hypothetical protein